MAKLTKEQAVQLLHKHQFFLEQAVSKSEALAVLKEAGSAVGYTPAFRCLVMGKTPEESVRWQD